ncbi:hypothetical protein MMC30_008201 [Trapelia coarctata]|nr:hypothetical protein [Trapelia coarctata]
MHSARPFSLAKAIGNGFLVDSRAFHVFKFLAPSVNETTWAKQRSQRQLQGSDVCHHASFSTDSRHTVDIADALATPPPPQQSDEFGQPTRKRLSPEAWAELLDPYLPLELRSKGWLQNLAAFEGVRPIITLPSLLTEARRAFPLGLLGHIAVDQGRWAAWLWLIQEILKHDTNGIRKPTHDAIPGLPKYGPGLLDELTMDPISAEIEAKVPRSQLGSFDDMTEHCSVADTEVTDAGINPTNSDTQAMLPSHPLVSLDEITGSIPLMETAVYGAMKDAVGQIWQSIAKIILEAAEREPEQTRQMMSYVHQAIALLHHHGWIPQSIYSCESGEVPLDLRKPPLLEILSWRIMTTLSDSVWKARERELVKQNGSTDANFAYKGRELPGGEYQPRIRPLGPATWLEFALWSCVGSSMIPDASRIIGEIAKRKGRNEWKVINWDALQESATNRRRDAAKVKPGFIQWWLNNLRGTSEGYSEELPLIEMDKRTVSSEVIANIVDGLVASIRDNAGQHGMRSSAVRHFVNRCKSLLDRQDYTLETGFWNSVVLRLIEFEYYPPLSAPGILSRVLDLSGGDQKPSQEKAGPESPESPENQSELMVGHSAASLGLLYQILDNYCSLGDAMGAVRTFKRIQNWTNDNRKYAQRENPVGFDGRSDPIETNEEDDITIIGYHIPESTLAAFLTLLTDAKEYTMGNLLLSSEGANVPVITPRLYESPTLQPALLRFASVTSNSELVKAVIDCMASQSNSFSEGALKAILHCQIKLRNWPEVDKLFNHLANERRLQVETLDIMTLAGTIVRIQQVTKLGESDQIQLSQAQGMLKLLLRGKYRLEPDPSQPRDYSQLRLLNQCNRILASVPELVPSTVLWNGNQDIQAHAPVPIPARAFNILLDAVVEVYGCERGKAMVDAWCPVRMDHKTDVELKNAVEEEIDVEAPIEGGTTSWSAENYTNVQERVVVPNQQTIRTVLQPLSSTVQANRGPYPTEALLEWGAGKYRELGLTNSEINTLIPASFLTKKRGNSRISQIAVHANDKDHR